MSTHPDSVLSEILRRAGNVTNLNNRLHFRVHRFGSVRRFKLDPIKSLIETMFSPAPLNSNSCLGNRGGVTVLLSKAILLESQHVRAELVIQFRISLRHVTHAVSGPELPVLQPFDCH